METSPIEPAPDGDGGGPAPPDDLVTIPRAELEALRSLAAAPAEEAPARGHANGPVLGPGRHGADAEERRREAEAARDRRLVELERSCKAAVRDRDLVTALAGKSLVAGAAAQLLKLWRDDFDAFEEGGGYKVAARDGRPVGQVVNDWLASPEYAHFCLPASRGGTGSRDASRPSGPATPRGAPRNLGESIVMKWREEAATRPGTLHKPIGLRRDR